MHPLLRKLNVKGHSRLVALAAPPELGPTLEAMKPELLVRTRLGAREELVLVFVRRGADIEARAAELDLPGREQARRARPADGGELRVAADDHARARA